MNSSPVSIVSSSDLFQGMDAAEPKARAQEIMELPLGSERLHPNSGSYRGDMEDPAHFRSGVTTVPQGFGNEEVQTSLETRTNAVSMANGGLQRYQKRKREDQEEDEPQEKVPSREPTNNMLQLNRSIGYGSGNQTFLDEGKRDPVGDQASKKRPKPNNSSPHFIAQAQNLFQSHGLPAELWQYIFCFVPPVFLGRLLLVNHAFHTYLTQDNADEQDPKPIPFSVAQPLSPQAIWAASRRLFCPGLPKPIRGLQELSMWQLLRGRDCQTCGRTKGSALSPNPENPWESGPGENGVRVIWPFAIRCCGKCLHEKSEKEVNLLFSSDYSSVFLPALPFAFISSSNNYITSTALRNPAHPSMLQLTKHYYKPHIEEIKHRLKAAKDLGNASADEWIKGLEAEGKDRLSEVIRWEQWEAKGGLRKVNPRPHQRAAMTQGQTNLSFKTLDTKGGPNSERSTPLGMRIPSRLSGDSGSPASASPIHYPYFHQPTSTSVSTPWTTAAPHAENSLPRNPMSISQLRPERNLRDVNEAKAARRAEIERRCAALDPPLLPSVLAHMETFQAAMQISQPLSDHAWQVLKPRLLTQRAYAERKEKDRLEQSQILQAEYKQRRQQEAQLKETKESLDREWASTQTPIRSRIGELADEIINNTWAYGKSVTKDNCAKFAADVLLYVRQRFYDEVAQENKDSILNGEEYKDANPNLPTSRTLILENMKWLFDTKIKPLTEHFQKELFLCNGCDNFKFYGLDSVVQHYAAKHTHDLSLGNQVVHWRAEWPKHPPFHPEPSVAKAAYYKIPTPLGTSLQPVKQEGYAPVSYPVSQSAYNGSQYSPRSYQESYGQDHQQEKHPSLSFTQTFPHAIPGVPGQVQEFQQNPNFVGAYNALQTTYANAVSASNGPQPTRFGQLLPTDNQRSTGLPGYDYFSRNHGGASIPQHQSNSQPKTLSFQRSYPEHNRDLIGQALELYQPQIEEIAKYAREVWFATSGIKDIPQSVRIFVVIQHMVARFKAVFPNEPSLAMFIDGLDHSQLMRPIRSLNGLACKVCVTGGSSTSGEPLPIGDRRLYTLPHLLNHFRTAHMETSPTYTGSIGGIESSRLDWKLDMIELPEEPLIADLINAPGLDDTKLDLIARVFPGVFPSPLPRMGIASNIGPVPVYSESFDRGTRSLSKVGPEAFRVSPSRHEGRLEDQQFNRSYSSYREISQPARSSEPPGEDEYDPHRPALPSVVSSIHTRKPAMAPSTDNTTPSTLKSRQDTYSMVSEAIERPEPVYNIPPSRRVIGIHDASPYYEQSNRTRSRASYQDVVRPLAEDRFGDEHAAHREQPLGENPNRNNTAVDASTKHKDISEDGEVVDGSTSFKPMQRSLSSNEEANAADQFLDNLVSSPDLNSGHRIIPFGREGSRSIARREEMPQDRNRMKHVDANEESQGWRAELAVGQKQELDPAGSMRDDPSIQRVYEENCPPRRCYDQHHRSPSQLQHTPNVSRIGRRSTETFAAYEAPQHTVGDNRYEMRGRVEVPRISDGPFHVATHPRYRSRSMSPRPLPISTTYYRTRSPGEDYRHEPIYHIRSPTLRKDAQRIISYDYPVQDRYEYYDERNMPHNQLRPRVEYVPVRFRESAPIEPSRFVLTQPTEMRPQSDYVRLDRGHPGEPVYERHGQLYHADPSPVFSQQGYGAPTFSPGYRY